jgi:hypothetical protein
LPSNSLQNSLQQGILQGILQIAAIFAVFGQNTPAIPESCSEIPYAGEQGIFAGLAGNFCREQGITGNLRERR